MPREADELAALFGDICAEASVPVMEVYATDFTPDQKADRSPVTAADKRAEMLILDRLSRDLPDTPVIAEESYAAGVRPDIDGDFLLVDPVDGTKEFINKNGEFTINIALISRRRPVAGCVYAPAMKRIYIGGTRAWAGALSPGETFDAAALEPVTTRPVPSGGLTAVMSRSHADQQTQDFADRHGVTQKVSAGSSLKFCLIAEGRADLYPRFGPTCEWDTGAGHAVLNAAGGCVSAPDGSEFLYAKSEHNYLNGAFVAWATPEPGKPQR